jgi:hypothetical protein
MGNTLSDLPDYAALKKLATALWQENEGFQGAAVMVGAGFSRSAARIGDASNKLPLWQDLSGELARELSSGSAIDPLRLAEEYVAYFGRQSLHDLLRARINDAAWTPGDLHLRLLELPWSEVLTTNWDTLLERAALDVHQPVYNTVACQEDLASARSPRIVKLHGTISTADDLVFTQEDYRRYPERNAAFVNFARQVFIENELCLLGFSGDDPNFLQWTGWVRDHLTSNARRIYLVGALNLTAAKRRYLDSLNVSPVDLYPVVKHHDERDQQHLEATKLFIEALSQLKPISPWEWSPSQLARSTYTEEEFQKTRQDAAYAARLLEGQLPALERDRAAYPGWLVCPPTLRSMLQMQISDPHPTQASLAAMEPATRERLLFEIGWRYGLTFELTRSWLAKEMIAICDPDRPCAITRAQQLQLALLVLKCMHWHDDDESASLAKEAECVLERGHAHWPECADELTYHRALQARDRFDFSSLESLTDAITPRDPVWRLRKASLLADLGRYSEAETQVTLAHRELLQQYRRARNSLFTFSRLVWANWLLSGIDAWKPESEAKPDLQDQRRQRKCDPWEQIEHLRREMTTLLDRQSRHRPIEPAFRAGRYRSNSGEPAHLGDSHPLFLLAGLCNGAGVPLRLNHVTFAVDLPSRLAELHEVKGRHQFALAIRAADSETADILNRVFSRTLVACLSAAEASSLIGGCMLATRYWAERLSLHGSVDQHHARGRLRVFMEVLARLSVRAGPTESISLFELGIALGNRSELRDLWLREPISHLLDYSLESIPAARQNEVLLASLSFPLEADIGKEGMRNWPNPVVNHPGTRSISSTLDRRIGELIDAALAGTRTCPSALTRLRPLIEKGFLRETELIELAGNIWKRTASGFDYPQTGLLNWALLPLPSPAPKATRALIRTRLFPADRTNLLNSTALTELSGAAQKSPGLRPELPSRRQAIEYFETLITWRPPEEQRQRLFFDREDELGDGIGDALGRSIIPALPEAALNKHRFDALCTFCVDVDAPAALRALPRFAASSSEFVRRAVRLIGDGLRSSRSKWVAQASFALLTWRRLQKSPATCGLVSRLVQQVGLNMAPGRTAMLWTIRELYRDGFLSKSETARLVECLPDIFESCDYSKLNALSEDAVSASLTRAACAKLASDILKMSGREDSALRHLLKAATTDQLPEVRFAEEDD